MSELPASPSVRITQDANESARWLVDEILALVTAKPKAVLGVATGSSPKEVYRLLAKRAKPGVFDQINAFALDEYTGLDFGDSHSYRAELWDTFAAPLGMAKTRLHTPDSEFPGDYELKISEAGGVDLQILGIGRNGHIAFNEPGAPFDSLTRVVKLTEATRRDNARFFSSIDQVPTHAVTQGLGTIMRARRIVLIANGTAKAEAIRETLYGEVSVLTPASVLRRHPNATLLLDRHLWEAI